MVLSEDVARKESLTKLLDSEGFIVEHTHSGVNGESEIDTVLLDWETVENAHDICDELKAKNPMLPVIALTSVERRGVGIRALNAGADDFLAGLELTEELVARLEAATRRMRDYRRMNEKLQGDTRVSRVVFKAGAVELDRDAREVRVEGRAVPLSLLEYKLFEYLCDNVGRAVSRPDILRDVYGYQAEIPAERVDLLVRRLRGKLGTGGMKGGMISAVPSFGYRLDRRYRGDRA